MLRVAQENPKLSAYAYIFGHFDWSATPLVPPGTRVLTYDKLAQRPVWAPHGEEGWIVEASKEHYIYIKVYFPATRAEKDVGTVIFCPKTVTFLKIKLEDFLR